MREMNRFTLVIFGTLAAISVVAALAVSAGLSWFAIACSGVLFLLMIGLPVWSVYQAALKESEQLDAILSQLPEDVQGEAFKIIVDLESRVLDLSTKDFDAAMEQFAEYDGFEEFKELLLARLSEYYEFRRKASGMPLHGVHDI